MPPCSPPSPPPPSRHLYLPTTRRRCAIGIGGPLFGVRSSIWQMDRGNNVHMVTGDPAFAEGDPGIECGRLGTERRGPQLQNVIDGPLRGLATRGRVQAVEARQDRLYGRGRGGRCRAGEAAEGKTPPPPPKLWKWGVSLGSLCGMGVQTKGHEHAAVPPPPPLCHISSGCSFFTGPWTVPRSPLRVLRQANSF